MNAPTIMFHTNPTRFDHAFRAVSKRGQLRDRVGNTPRPYVEDRATIFARSISCYWKGFAGAHDGTTAPSRKALRIVSATIASRDSAIGETNKQSYNAAVPGTIGTASYESDEETRTRNTGCEAEAWSICPHRNVLRPPLALLTASSLCTIYDFGYVQGGWSMHSIDVDFEVLKALMAQRTSEDISYNDVIRGLLRLSPKPRSTKGPSSPTPGDWLVKGVRFAAGTEFRGKYRGRVLTARVESGGLALNGKRYYSPSAAAVAITGYAVNGWNFWECRAPGGEWRLMATYRQGA